LSKYFAAGIERLFDPSADGESHAVAWQAAQKILPIISIDYRTKLLKQYL